MARIKHEREKNTPKKWPKSPSLAVLESTECGWSAGQWPILTCTLSFFSNQVLWYGQEYGWSAVGTCTHSHYCILWCLSSSFCNSRSSFCPKASQYALIARNGKIPENTNIEPISDDKNARKQYNGYGFEGRNIQHIWPDYRGGGDRFNQINRQLFWLININHKHH